MNNAIISYQHLFSEHPLLSDDIDINLGVPASELKVAVADNYANILLNGQTVVEETETVLPRRSKRHQLLNAQQEIITDCKDDIKNFCKYRIL